MVIQHFLDLHPLTNQYNVHWFVFSHGAFTQVSQHRTTLQQPPSAPIEAGWEAGTQVEVGAGSCGLEASRLEEDLGGEAAEDLANADGADARVLLSAIKQLAAKAQ